MSERSAFAAETMTFSLVNGLCPRSLRFEAAYAVLRETSTLCRNCAESFLVRRQEARRKIKETEDGRFRDLILARQKVSKGERGLEDVYCPSE